jgi:hypothetical protein
MAPPQCVVAGLFAVHAPPSCIVVDMLSLDADLAQAKAGLARALEADQSSKRHAARVAQRAAKEGMSEVEIAKRLDVNRLTVRRWLGK